MPNRDGLKIQPKDFPVLPPDQALSDNQAYQSLYMAYRNLMAGIGTDKQVLLAALQAQKAGILQQRTQGLTAVVNNAIGRGVLGSSQELEARTDVRAQAAAAVAQAEAQTNQGLAADQLKAQQGLLTLQSGMANIANQDAFMQMLMAIQQFQNGSLSLPPGWGPPGAGGAPVKRVPQNQVFRNLVNQRRQ